MVLYYARVGSSITLSRNITGSLVLQISGCLIYAFLLYEFKRARLAWEQLEKQEEINIYLTFY